MTENNKNAFEHEMAKRNNAVITIKNIDDEDFTHAYDGVPYTIKAGETLPFPYPVGVHLAKHLAMRMSRKDFHAEDKNTRKQSTNLYSAERLSNYTKRMVVNREERPVEPVKSEGERMKERSEEMQKEFKNEASVKASDVTKADIIAELDKRNIKYNARLKKEELLQLLTEAEMAGNTGEDE